MACPREAGMAEASSDVVSKDLVPTDRDNESRRRGRRRSGPCPLHPVPRSSTVRLLSRDRLVRNCRATWQPWKRCPGRWSPDGGATGWIVAAGCGRNTGRDPIGARRPDPRAADAGGGPASIPGTRRHRHVSVPAPAAPGARHQGRGCVQRQPSRDRAHGLVDEGSGDGSPHAMSPPRSGSRPGPCARTLRQDPAPAPCDRDARRNHVSRLA